jgi:hypothetical protein
MRRIADIDAIKRENVSGPLSAFTFGKSDGVDEVRGKHSCHFWIVTARFSRLACAAIRVTGRAILASLP